jgi:hypothetical protein
MHKLAFCFLIKDIIHNQKLWTNFFKDVDKSKYNIYIHYKEDVNLKNFNEYKLKKCIPTNWGDVTLIHAHNLLFTEAYKDENNYKIISLSGNCIPLKSFNHIYDFLIKTDKAYFSINNPDNVCFPRANNLLKKYSKETIHKSYNWFILNRDLVKKICFIPEYEIDLIYKNVSSPEEHFYITEVYNLNLQDQIIDIDTTFVNWGKKIGDKVNKNHPKLYNEITKKEYEYLNSKHYLFGRKFYNNFMILDKPRPFCTIQ